MKRETIKKVGCVVAVVLILGIPIFFVGELYYYCIQERNYVKIDNSNTITIWKKYIIFEKYWSPFYPKNDYIFVNSTWDHYDASISITQDSVLGIWCNYPVEVHGLKNFKMVQTYESEERDVWSKQYSFAHSTDARQGSLQIELDYELWYPCYLKKATYTYKSDDGIVTRDFSSK